MLRSAVTAMLAVLLLALPAAAGAATPASGEVSNASPHVKWSGEVINSYPNRIPVLLTEDDTFPCLPQSCDTFALKVVDSGDLTITADAPEGTSTDGSSGTQVTLRIRKPDGSVSVHSSDTSGVSPDKPLIVKLKKAPAGDYEIEYFNYYLASAGFIPYTATATLGSAPAPVAPVPAPSAPSEPAPAQPAGQEAIDLQVKVGKASARKLKRKRKLKARVTVSREVSRLTATLRKGRKVVGKGRLGTFTGTRNVGLKLSRKLRKGTYRLTVVATDGSGSSVTRTVKVKVRR